jgi:cytochrome P450
LQGWARRYGDSFTLSILPVGQLVVVTDPAALRKLFTGDPSIFRAGEATARLLPALGAGSILLADGEEHLRRRRRLLPLFHGESLASQADSIAEIAERELGRWPVGRRLPVLPRMRWIAFQVIARLVLGSVEPGRTAELQARLTRMLSGTSILASWYPWPARRGATRGPWAAFERRVGAVDELLLEQIRARGAALARAEPGNALSLLLSDHGEPSQVLSERELCDELRSLLIVGHETTASALAWALAELARAPAVLERLLAELEGGDRRYLEALIEETLRLHAPVVDAVRLFAEPVELGGFALPAGTIVLAALPLVHRRPELYADPGSFRPERFLERRPDPYSFVPFGGGLRRCLGAALALHELRIVLPLILQRFRLRPARPEPERARLVGTMLVPERGAELILERRGTERGGGAERPRRRPV